MACHWLPQVEANVAWQVVRYGSVGAVSFGHLPMSEHLTSSLPQPENAIVATVITARRSFCTSCPSELGLGKCGSVSNNGAHVSLPGEAAQEARALTAYRPRLDEDLSARGLLVPETSHQRRRSM